jgi:hypothetical protein
VSPQPQPTSSTRPPGLTCGFGNTVSL